MQWCNGYVNGQGREGIQGWKEKGICRLYVCMFVYMYVVGTIGKEK